MTIGDKSAQSYGWSARLEAPLPDGGQVVIPTPGIDQRYTDTEHADVTAASTNQVYRAGAGAVDAAFNMTEGAEAVTVTNRTGLEWPQGDQVYVYCPHLLAEGANEWDLKGQIWDLQQRVKALEGGSGEESLMATFVYDPAVRWPPPANILLNYNVVAPDDPIPAQKGVLRSTDVAPYTIGALRVTLVPDRVAALEAEADAVSGRVHAIEARINVPPVVVDETADYPAAELAVGVVIRTMQASGLPTSWEIFGQTMNGLPTTGYWEISAKGEVSPTEFGVGGLRKHSKVEVLVRAANEFGSGDGKFDIRIT